MRITFPLLVLLVLVLSACSAVNAIESPIPTPTATAIASTFPTAPAAETESTPFPATLLQPALAPTVATSGDQTTVEKDLTRTDEQGAVKVEVLPSNLSNPGDRLIFEVALNTHSVNLDMDLAKLATLNTDTGITIKANSWDGMSGGHHISGNLSFPSQANGKSLLEGVKVITLVIRNVDAPERTFTWKINP